MIGAHASIEVERPQLTLLDRATAWLAIGLSAWVLFEYGWPILRPNDPVAPVSLMSAHRSAFLAAFPITVLTAVCAAVGTLLAARRVADIGLFSAMVGLIALSVRGDTSEYFLLLSATPAPARGPGLGFVFLIESIGWIGVSAAAAIAAGAVMKWRFGGLVQANGTEPHFGLLPAVSDIPRLGMWFTGTRPVARTPVDLGVKHTVVVTAAGLFAFLILSIGSHTRSIQHGQAIFTVAAAVCIACYVGFQAAPVRSALWPAIGAALMVLIAYLWAAFRPTAPGLPPTVPPSPFLRVLPIQFVSAAIGTAIAMAWYMHGPQEYETADSR